MFYPGWLRGHPDNISSDYNGSMDLGLVPFLPAQRPRLGDLINIVAVPEERMAEFRSCFS
jgi:hypothetical protein